MTEPDFLTDYMTKSHQTFVASENIFHHDWNICRWRASRHKSGTLTVKKKCDEGNTH